MTTLRPADLGSTVAAAEPDMLASAAALAEGFARQMQRWAIQRGAAAPVVQAVAAAARALSLATSGGHVCLDLADWLAEPVAERRDPRVAAQVDEPMDEPVDVPVDEPVDALHGPAAAPRHRLATLPAGDERLSRWRTHLLASGLVGTPQRPGGQALILDDEHRLYLHRYFDFERRLAGRAGRRAQRPAGGCAGR